MIKKAAKSYENDPDTLSIRCPKNHLLLRDNGVPGDLVDDNHRPKCFKCKQPNLPAHQMYYRCIHEECKVKGQYYELCRVCALCENEDPKKPMLKKSIQCDFYPGKLYRHPIKNPNQWTCHTQTPRMQEWIESTRIRGLSKKCESNYVDIVQDNTAAIGYESRDGDFDICIRCLLKLKD
jgi:hypothetical protein